MRLQPVTILFLQCVSMHVNHIAITLVLVTYHNVQICSVTSTILLRSKLLETSWHSTMEKHHTTIHRHIQVKHGEGPTCACAFLRTVETVSYLENDNCRRQSACHCGRHGGRANNYNEHTSSQKTHKIDLVARNCRVSSG